LVTQKIDSFFYLSAAPYYLDSITIKSGDIISVVTFVYFISLFAFIGFLMGRKVRLPYMAGIVILILVVHLFLGSLGGRNLFTGLLKALKMANQTEVAMDLPLETGPFES
jgi:hypothetical protein